MKDPAGPHIDIQQAESDVKIPPGLWRVCWTVKNLMQEPLAIQSVWLPHGQFRSAEREFSPPLMLSPHESAALVVSVACNGGPEMTVENAFVILRVVWLEEPWRIFVRLRVSFDTMGSPRASTELVTTQRVGFAKSL